MDDGMNTHTGSGHGERGGGGRGATRVDPADRAQLAESPVEIRRVLALFGPHRRALSSGWRNVALDFGRRMPKSCSSC